MIGFWLINIVLALAISATVTTVMFSLVGAKVFGKKPQNISSRGDHEHKFQVPLSGFLLLPVTLMSTLLALGILSFWNAAAVKSNLLDTGIDPFFLICALTLMYLIGICKDLSRVKEFVNLIAQGFCAAFIVLSGLRITSLQGLFSIGDISSTSGIVITVMVILISINAVSSFTSDASKMETGKGICSLVLLYYSLVLIGFGQFVFAALAATALGCSIIGGNFNQKNPLLRLGSTGGLTMGLIVSILAIRLCQAPIESQVCPWLGVNPVILALAPIVLLPALEGYAQAIKVNTNTNEQK